MIYGFEDCTFYVDIPSTREIGNYISGGIDSQMLLHSLMTQGIPVECSFLLARTSLSK